ncbi:MAG: phosphatidylglycerol lysyltransferase domain-containing protein [Dysgonamonadaceae bacterium]|jgi:hypothetical protein|nr:phosphatidylglycerol lysyltransferase domain-containing protein [Dysgonamonadaceae bacterium]
MIDFKPVTIEDRELMQSFFDKSEFRNCDFSFSNIFCWKHLYSTTFAVENGFLLIRFTPSSDIPGYMFPLGGGDLKTALQLISDDAAERGFPMCLYAVTRKMFEQIEAACPGQFVYESDRNWSEYIYNSDDLITLAGKKYQPKRNHIHKFKREYEWEYLPITREIIPDCQALYRRWCAENGGCDESRSLFDECLATQTAFDNFERLHLIGGAIRIDGKILAYSYGQPLGQDTFGVHAEKSLYEIDGGFTIINQQFAEHNGKNYKYINREEDLGLESLRKAKLSYHPAILLEKGWVKRIGE